jgi:hypothetical protein
VENIDDELTACQETVCKEFARADGYRGVVVGLKGKIWVRSEDARLGTSSVESCHPPPFTAQSTNSSAFAYTNGHEDRTVRALTMIQLLFVEALLAAFDEKANP